MVNSLKTPKTGKAVKPTRMPNLSEPFTSLQLAKAITAKRTGMRLSLVDISEALSISKPTLVKIEKGDTNVMLVNILKVMEYLGLSFNILTDDISSNTIDGLNDDWY